jgi:hypothetical protein
MLSDGRATSPAAPSIPGGGVAALITALASRGLSCDVTVRGTAAFLVPGGAEVLERFAEEPTRCDVTTLARAHGFTHVAVVLGDG